MTIHWNISQREGTTKKNLLETIISYNQNHIYKIITTKLKVLPIKVFSTPEKVQQTFLIMFCVRFVAHGTAKRRDLLYILI